MNITIQEMLKAIEDGETCSRQFDDEPEITCFIRKSNGFIERSLYADFSGHLDRHQEFSTYEICSAFWKIVETEIKPCIYCGTDTALAEPHHSNRDGWTVTCENDNCFAESPLALSKAAAIQNHNAMYDRLHMPVNDDGMKKHLKRLIEILDNYGFYERGLPTELVSELAWLEKQV